MSAGPGCAFTDRKLEDIQALLGAEPWPIVSVERVVEPFGRRMAEIVPLVDYIARKRLASPLSFTAGGNIYNAVLEQVTIFAFGSIAPISPPVLGVPTMGVAKNARLYWGATVLADFQAAATQNGVWASDRHRQQGQLSRKPPSRRR
jgi:hypothetical protein